jgi:lipid A 3-O-deacylase
MKPRYVLIAALLYSFFCSAQKPAEISIISDNDLYTSPVNDQYYTNGIEIIYRYLGTSSNENVAKKITEFRLGQYIYNPQSVRAEDINVHDRPFAGYLFAEAGINTFYKNESVLKLNFQGGVVGPESYAEQFQEGLHKLVGYPTVKGWQYQIPTTLALQAQAVYSHKILSGRFHEKVDFHLQGEVNAGTIWMGAAVGPMVRISLKRPLLPVYDSALHGAALNHNKELYKEQRELFLYVNPTINYQAYDATIEGSMFSDTKPPVTWPIKPFRFIAEAGVKYRYNNWTYSYSFNYRSKELTNRAITSHYYGSIVLSYRL